MDRALGWPPGYSGVVLHDAEARTKERNRSWAVWDQQQASKTAAPIQEILIGPFRLRRHEAGRIEIMNSGEGGDFNDMELAEAIGRFVSERL